MGNRYYGTKECEELNKKLTHLLEKHHGKYCFDPNDQFCTWAATTFDHSGIPVRAAVVDSIAEIEIKKIGRMELVEITDFTSVSQDDAHYFLVAIPGIPETFEHVEEVIDMLNKR